MKPWYFLGSGAGEPAFNMALDEALLEFAGELGVLVLRLYSWTQPSASFGYFQHYAEVEKLILLRPLVRRPTGGGIVPHDGDWTYSLVFPPQHEWYHLRAVESYRRLHEWIQASFARMMVETELAPAARKTEAGQCFIGYEKLDLLWRGQKIAGAAQRRTRQGLLIQGSVQPPPLGLSRDDWQEAMKSAASSKFGVDWKELSLPKDLTDRADQLVEEKYAREPYNQKR